MMATSPEQLAARRARVKEMTAMTDAMRKKQRAEAKRKALLQEKAEMILAGLTSHSKPKASVTETVARSEAPTEATRTLATGVKYDKLASAADQLIKELQAA